MKSFLVAIIVILALGLGFSACSNNPTSTTESSSISTNTSNQEPINVVSVSAVGPPNPGGPTVKITLKNVGVEPVVSLIANLKLEGEKIFEYDFPDVSSDTPLKSGVTVSQTLTLIGPTGYSDEAFYPLTINVILPNGSIFTYTKQVQIN
jgi:hypothetical protein